MSDSAEKRQIPVIGWGIEAVLLLVRAGHKWSRDRATRMAAALSFYAALSLAPLLIFAVSLAGLFFSTEFAQDELLKLVEQFLGEAGAALIEPLLTQVVDPTAGTIAAVIGLIALLFGATSLFRQLQDSMNTIWRVPEEKQFGLISQLFKWAFSLLMVLVVGLLFVLMVVTETITETILELLSGFAPRLASVFDSADWAFFLFVSFIIFAITFRFVPRARVAWRDVWLATLVTSVLFFVGQALIGFYLATFGGSSLYGLAGSLVVVLIWVYYTAQILLFGACLSYVFALAFGSRQGQDEVAVPALDNVLVQLNERFPDVEIMVRARKTETDEAGIHDKSGSAAT